MTIASVFRTSKKGIIINKTNQGKHTTTATKATEVEKVNLSKIVFLWAYMLNFRQQRHIYYPPRTQNENKIYRQSYTSLVIFTTV